MDIISFFLQNDLIKHEIQELQEPPISFVAYPCAFDLLCDVLQETLNDIFHMLHFSSLVSFSEHPVHE